MTHRYALKSMDIPYIKLLLYTVSLIYLLSSSCSTAHKAPSKLLSLTTNITNTLYFKSVHYGIDIREDDDIFSVHLDTNTLTITTYSNHTHTFQYTHQSHAHLPVTLHYDNLIEWDQIYSANGDILAHRRRLGRWNIAHHVGRYVADGITRRFKDAQANCEHLHGELASIMSKEEEEEVKDLCAMFNQGNCWIGYKKPWGHWEDGRRPTYLHWKPGEPNNYGGNEGCAEIHTSGQWNDIKCKLSRIAICERPRIHVVGHYLAVMRKINWWDANKRCQELFSTDLATIENARENIMVRRACAALNPEKPCWLGLSRPFRTWNDGEDAKITNWADGEPNNLGGNENCAEITDTQRWNDANCWEAKYFVCNTITQSERAKKRMEAKRKKQEREAELEKKRKKMEDQIMERYMKQNQNSMMGRMEGGQGLYGGQNGIGSSMGNMMAYGQGGRMNPQQMYQMGSPQGQQSGMFNNMLTQQTGSMGGVGARYGGGMNGGMNGGMRHYGGLDNKP
eukprot:76529_1